MVSGIKNFVSERDDFIFNLFRNFKPVKRLVAGGRFKRWQMIEDLYSVGTALLTM